MPCFIARQCLYFIVRSLYGRQWFIIELNVVCIFPMFVLGDKSVSSSVQSWSASCLFREFMFWTLVSLDLTTISSLFAVISELKTQTIGK